MESFPDKLVGTTTEVIEINSPILRYHEDYNRFEIMSSTKFTIKDMNNGTLWDKEYGIYSIK